jgi:hypothetical protein
MTSQELQDLLSARSVSLGINARKTNKQTNSVASVCERTIPTEQPPFIGEVSANFCEKRVVAWLALRIPMAVIAVFWTGAATFLSGSSSILLRLSGPRSRPTTSQKIW